ncbi:hypothetical protein QBC43DRAFT_367539 [Cladorrhinum sp. PSN259]|nr:hypothetical protein QBC43DRAFT_367539 [Cladorrhinum sp. PSN259]
MADSKVDPQDHEAPGFLKNKWPVLLPKKAELSLSDSEFDTFLSETVKPAKFADKPKRLTAADDQSVSLKTDSNDAQGNKFMEGLLVAVAEPNIPISADQMLTENGDVAFKTSKSSLVDLFYELEETVSSSRLHDLLVNAWAEDAPATLKIIFNARSIHLGKSSRTVFYRCAGWLAEYHPLTLIKAIQWLSRPVIPKKVEKKGEEDKDDDMVLVDAMDAGEEDERTRFDVKDGVSHGYWKDMLNLLVMAANDKLTVFSNPRDVLNIKGGGANEGSNDRVAASSKRREIRSKCQQRASRLLEEDPVYRGLHLTVARLFAEQIKADIALVKDNNAKARRHISLCGKWAPSSDRFHDKHTLIASSIAELLYPEHLFAGSADVMANRETYLRHARELYRKDLSALRKQLDIVERNLTANTLTNINYERVPSVAMNNYTKIFFTKDEERFNAYLTRVAEGKARISGATLLPSTLIKAVRSNNHQAYSAGQKRPRSLGSAEVYHKVADGQWKTLVQRIKDSGTMESSIAVCDVSGSMGGPVFKDGTAPIDSAIGLSLLLAEVTKAPFGGTFITFSESPEVVTLDLSKTLWEKYQSMNNAAWGMNTDFVAVFERLILPMAIKNKVPPEDMVKRVFVFSDMQFDDASQNYGESDQPPSWSTSFQRVESAFNDAGYEVPELVFWNLAGGRDGYERYDRYESNVDSDVAPKPVTADQEGVSLVSGYSQGMLKVFMDKGMFEDEEVKDEDVEMKEEEGEEEVEDGVLVEKKKKQKKDPLSLVKKAISHKAYEMLQVVD